MLLSDPKSQKSDVLPTVLAGPIIRRIQSDRLAIWLAVRAQGPVKLELFPPEMDARIFELDSSAPELLWLRAGDQLSYLLIDLVLSDPLPDEVLIPYRLSLLVEKPEGDGPRWENHTHWAKDLCYPGRELPFIRIPKKVSSVMHGSCRKPHSSCADGLVAADRAVERAISDNEAEHPMPELLVLSGDQVYVDDAAGPMVQAITALVHVLGLPDETLPGIEPGAPASGTDLRNTGGFLYKRDQLLPKIDQNASVFDVLFGGTQKPIFTSLHARNHLMTLAEMLAMYLLVWSPACWDVLPGRAAPEDLSDKDRRMYDREVRDIDGFVSGLGNVRRLLAHIPTAMIFDDHDVTDDWNLSLAWEEAAYGHPLARRVIGNALIAYGINQGWGNRPKTIREDLKTVFEAALQRPGTEDHEAAIDHILDYEKWDFEWPTDPPLIALDTRTRRWRSERNSHFPSGLLDWEAATELQAGLRNKDAVLLVSAAPIFGVKLIETVQKLFTLLGKPLMVDAEYWMAHPGTASAILNIFQHRNTPKHFVILSGDVHYSFVYDVELRNGRKSRTRQSGQNPEIWQVCSSGIKNKWPDRLLAVLDHGNRWAFAPRSPLNWLTKRRGMRIIPRKPEGTPHGRRILNAPGIGLVELSDDGAPVRISQLASTGDIYDFERREDEAHYG
ncbi:alkaline phosphatase family protein [Labrenzia sp. R4_2]|uniref:alkaline phosphatase family protein n=1 Tax=Labrenzia sp. R4_2 TaxID=2821107 RepID=UPI00256FB58C|nr:alkaline phosphatase family protein [Labrenzia sp. R4_2]